MGSYMGTKTSVDIVEKRKGSYLCREWNPDRFFIIPTNCRNIFKKLQKYIKKKRLTGLA